MKTRCSWKVKVIYWQGAQTKSGEVELQHPCTWCQQWAYLPDVARPVFKTWSSTSPGRYRCLSTALKVTQQQWRAVVYSVFVDKVTLSMCTNSLFRSLCFFVPDFGGKFLMRDAFISLSLRANPWEERLPQNTINVFPKPQKAVQPSWKWMFTRGKGVYNLQGD